MVVVVVENDAVELGPSGSMFGVAEKDAGELGPFGAVVREPGMLFVFLVVLGG